MNPPSPETAVLTALTQHVTAAKGASATFYVSMGYISYKTFVPQIMHHWIM